MLITKYLDVYSHIKHIGLHIYISFCNVIYLCEQIAVTFVTIYVFTYVIGLSIFVN